MSILVFILGAQFVPEDKVSSYGIVSGEALADNFISR